MEWNQMLALNNTKGVDMPLNKPNRNRISVEEV